MGRKHGKHNQGDTITASNTGVIQVVEEPIVEHGLRMKDFVATTNVPAEEILSRIQGFPFSEQLTGFPPGQYFTQMLSISKT